MTEHPQKLVIDDILNPPPCAREGCKHDDENHFPLKGWGRTNAPFVCRIVKCKCQGYLYPGEQDSTPVLVK